MPKWLEWWEAHGGGRWLGTGVQLLVVVALCGAVVLVALSSWEQHAQLLQRRAQEQGAIEMMVIANKICEARLDRLQGIMTMVIQRQDVVLERFREREEARARALMPRREE